MMVTFNKKATQHYKILDIARGVQTLVFNNEKKCSYFMPISSL